MKVIDIKKHYCNGTKQHYLVLFGENYTDEAIQYEVEDWCDSDPSGSCYGYTYNWSNVIDRDILIDVLHNEKLLINGKISRLIKSVDNIDTFIYKLYE